MKLLDIFGYPPEYVFLGIVAGIAIYIAIVYYFMRYVFAVKRQLWNQKQQINLLIRIAIKLGVNENDEQLTDIKEKNNNPSNEYL